MGHPTVDSSGGGDLGVGLAVLQRWWLVYGSVCSHRKEVDGVANRKECEGCGQ